MTAKNGTAYYAYIPVYLDDILIIDKNPERFTSLLKENYTVKPSSIGEPKVYLGADIWKAYYSDGSYAWTMGLQSYVKEAFCNVKKQLFLYNLIFNNKLLDVKYSPTKTTFSSIDYKSELDTSLMCNQNQTNYFQNLIGVLCWIIKLGRINIAYDVSSQSKYLANSQTGHIYQALYIFKYLETHIKKRFVLRPSVSQSRPFGKY